MPSHLQARRLEALRDWGACYAVTRIGPDDCDPYMLFRIWNIMVICRRRFIIRLDFRNLPKSRRSLTTWWLIWDRGAADACSKTPGFDNDLVVNASIDVLTKVWMGSVAMVEASTSGAIRLEGETWASDTLVRFLDLRRTPCVKTWNYGPPPDDDRGTAVPAVTVSTAAQAPTG